MTSGKVELWGGIECTLNRVKHKYFDQLHYTGHYGRGISDIDLIAALGVKRLRYPILWEKHHPSGSKPVDWNFAEQGLERLRLHGITPIVGLVHHGSGPSQVSFYDGSFESGLTAFAEKVARRFPWIEYFTPVNEPLTTARFCGLYGHWYPHAKSARDFYRILVSECKAISMSMAAVRKINPQAKLVQTEDLSKTYSTPSLRHQAAFENNRRWLSYDLLCGRVDPHHPLWEDLLLAGITDGQLASFREDPCIPDIAGFNYYVISERYLDRIKTGYPRRLHGGNGRQTYADVEAVRVPLSQPTGPAVLLREAWDHLRLPLAVTECHLQCTEAEQARWFHSMWTTVNDLATTGVDIRAITAWAAFGMTGWDKLVTRAGGNYEPGIFDVSSGNPRPTMMADLIRQLSENGRCTIEPNGPGWWERSDRYGYRHRRGKINL